MEKIQHFLKTTRTNKLAPYGLVIAAVVYVLFPLDIIADIIPLFGQTDDVIVLGMSIVYAVIMSRNRRNAHQENA